MSGTKKVNKTGGNKGKKAAKRVGLLRDKELKGNMAARVKGGTREELNVPTFRQL